VPLPAGYTGITFPPIVERDLDPSWSIGVLAQYTVLRYFKALLEQQPVVLANEDVEGVHQIRVAARRCRTALQTFHSLWDERKVRYFQKYLARFADTFGISRDLDVMIIYLSEQLEKTDGERAAAYQWLRARNQERRLKEQPRLEKTITKLEKDGFPAAFIAYFSAKPYDLWSREDIGG